MRALSLMMLLASSALRAGALDELSASEAGILSDAKNQQKRFSPLTTCAETYDDIGRVKRLLMRKMEISDGASTWEFRRHDFGELCFRGGRLMLPGVDFPARVRRRGASVVFTFAGDDEPGASSDYWVRLSDLESLPHGNRRLSHLAWMKVERDGADARRASRAFIYTVRDRWRDELEAAIAVIRSDHDTWLSAPRPREEAIGFLASHLGQCNALLTPSLAEQTPLSPPGEIAITTSQGPDWFDSERVNPRFLMTVSVPIGGNAGRTYHWPPLGEQ